MFVAATTEEQDQNILPASVLADYESCVMDQHFLNDHYPVVLLSGFLRRSLHLLYSSAQPDHKSCTSLVFFFMIIILKYFLHTCILHLHTTPDIHIVCVFMKEDRRLYLKLDGHCFKMGVIGWNTTSDKC